MNYTMKDLINIFEEAIENEANVLVVELEIDGYEDSEFIITPEDNFKNKLEFYKNTYDDNLCHKMDKRIKIYDISYHYNLNDMIDYIS